MDRDRSAGERVGPQEYALIQLQVVDPKPALLAKISKPIYRVAATVSSQEVKFSGLLYPLRWLLSKGLCFACIDNKDDKGTDVVTSAPFDSLDDYAALTDLKKKKPLRERYGITDEIVLPFDPVRRNLETTIDWLYEYACSRSYGLAGQFNGNVIGPAGMSWFFLRVFMFLELLDIAEQLTKPIWGSIFLETPYDAAKMPVPEEKLKMSRKEFCTDVQKRRQLLYPHIEYRDAEDGVEDVNFVFNIADGGVLRLYSMIDWVKNMTIRDIYRELCGGQDAAMSP
ncbi:hypothetical protein OESDEN_09924 [Oesophagostomum dentatum]|uniref:Uncharacterized protein n=1 Tax=Oesophagostomum dentatum TaxID=61180 RepID=A0A0B1T4D0_OESDE|nr:hypothetical protein OESDEN_09924 [Oesophagostomum dentatum]